MIVSLPMYDRPEMQAANDRLWAAIRARLAERGIDAPRDLTRHDDLWAQWEAPDLLLSQTCGLPYRSRLLDRVTLVGSPDFGLEGCPPGYYASKIVVRTDETRTDPAEWRGLVLAYNQDHSQSGWAAALNHAAGLGTGFARGIETGGHILSARAVAEGTADIAVIDAHTWRMIRTWDDSARALRIIGQTEPTPATPYITARDTPAETVAALREAMNGALGDLAPDDLELIGLRAVVQVPHDAYLAVSTPAA